MKTNSRSKFSFTHKPLTVSCMALVALLAASCLEGDGGDSSDLIESCSGSYTCTGSGETITTTLSKQNGICYAGKVELPADGKDTSDGVTVSWSGDTSAWDLTLTSASQSMTLHCVPNGFSGSTGGSGGYAVHGSGGHAAHSSGGRGGHGGWGGSGG